MLQKYSLFWINRAGEGIEVGRTIKTRPAICERYFIYSLPRLFLALCKFKPRSSRQRSLSWWRCCCSPSFSDARFHLFLMKDKRDEWMIHCAPGVSGGGSLVGGDMVLVVVVLVVVVSYLLHLWWWLHGLSWTCRWLHRGSGHQRQKPSWPGWWKVELESRSDRKTPPLRIPKGRRKFPDCSWIFNESKMGKPESFLLTHAAEE